MPSREVHFKQRELIDAYIFVQKTRGGKNFEQNICNQNELLKREAQKQHHYCSARSVNGRQVNLNKKYKLLIKELASEITQAKTSVKSLCGIHEKPLRASVNKNCQL